MAVLVVEEGVEEVEEESEVVMAKADPEAGSGTGPVGVTVRAVTASGHGVVAGGSVEMGIAPYIGMGVDVAMGAVVGGEDMLADHVKYKQKRTKATGENEQGRTMDNKVRRRVCFVMKARLNGEMGDTQPGTKTPRRAFILSPIDGDPVREATV